MNKQELTTVMKALNAVSEVSQKEKELEAAKGDKKTVLGFKVKDLRIKLHTKISLAKKVCTEEFDRI